MKQWKPPDHWLRIATIDAHTAGEPLRIITDGFPEIPGETILARRRFVKENLDHLRTALMWEPRGHREMYGCIITPPTSPDADFGVIFTHNEGYSTMCGHGIIGVTQVAVETGLIPKTDPETVIHIDSPAGLIKVGARVVDGRAQSVYFQNVPSYVVGLDETIEVPGLGNVQYDLAFGGAYYAYVQAAQFGLSCAMEENQTLVDKGMAIKRSIMSSRSVVHPFEEDLNFLYGTIFTAPAMEEGADSRNVCIFAEGEVDRSPTGTGLSGRLAIHHARGEIGVDEPMVIESIIGSRFKGRIIATTKFGNYDAVIPEVEGTAYITGRHEFFIDPKDSLKYGFILP